MDLQKEVEALMSKYIISAKSHKRFIPGESQIPVSGKLIDEEDTLAMIEASLEGWLTSGRFTSEFERGLSKFVGARSATFVNSGSSANLIALSALTSQKLGKRRISVGDEVITVAMGFPTTVNPIIQNNLVPVFVDIKMGTYDAVEEQMTEALSKKTKAVMMAHTLGNPFNVDFVKNFCDENNLWLIEDNCDALGSTYKGKKTGSFGDTATVSFYPAHHITTGEGGAVFSNSPLVTKQIESFRDWGRDCYCETGKDNTCQKRFDWKLGELPQGYDHKYIYSHIGYNLKATDLQAALGCSQLKKLDSFVAKRKENFNFLKSNLLDVAELILPTATEHSDPSWFGFPITLSPKANFSRDSLIRFLDSRSIGTRLMFAGNILRQPGYGNIKKRVIGSLENTDVVMNKSFWIGVYPGLSIEMLTYMSDSIKEFVQASRT